MAKKARSKASTKAGKAGKTGKRVSKSAVRSGRHKSSILKAADAKMKKRGRKKGSDGKMRGRMKKE